MNFDFSKARHPKDCKHFPAWHEFIDYVESHKAPTVQGACGRRRSSLNHTPCEDWDNSLGLDGAIQAARTGWPEGMAKADAISRPIVDAICSQIERADVMYDVEGIAIDVGRFVSDDPECWIRLENEIVTSPTASPRLISIACSCHFTCEVSASEIIRRGAHIMALVQALEYAGYRVELTVMPYAGNAAFVAATIKQFDQPLDVALAIYALAHPAVLRRLGFVFIENASFSAQATASSCYGFPETPVSDADIMIGSREGHIDMNWVMSELAKQGISLKQG